MKTSSRRPSPSFLVAVAALLVATGTTSYAAGLARNSVGTPQLKAGAVTSPKIKNGAVTGADLRDGSVGRADLAPGAVRPRTVTLIRELGPTTGNMQVLAVGRLRFLLSCSVDFRTAAVTLADEEDGTARLDVDGTYVREEGGTEATPGAVFVANVSGYQLSVFPPAGTSGRMAFNGAARSEGGPWVDVSMALRYLEGSATPCQLRVRATPVS